MPLTAAAKAELGDELLGEGGSDCQDDEKNLLSVSSPNQKNTQPKNHNLFEHGYP